MTRHVAPFSAQYEDLLCEILNHGFEERNERTGHSVLVAERPASITVDLDNRELPLVDLRRTHPRTAAVEVAWFASGRRDLEFLHRYRVRIWDKFQAVDEPEAAECSYGHRWRFHFGRDQLQLAVAALERDPSDRRVLVSAWDPSRDGLGARSQSNVPCPACFTLSVVRGRLNSTLLIRSSDVFVGLPYDVMGHAMLMDVVACSLGRLAGTMHVAIAHPHLYDSHFEMARQAVSRSNERVRPRVLMPQLVTLDHVVWHPDSYVEHFARQSRLAEWPEFDPKPELVL